jgi:hypothetical protein
VRLRSRADAASPVTAALVRLPGGTLGAAVASSERGKPCGSIHFSNDPLTGAPLVGQFQFGDDKIVQVRWGSSSSGACARSRQLLLSCRGVAVYSVYCTGGSLCTLGIIELARSWRLRLLCRGVAVHMHGRFFLCVVNQALVPALVHGDFCYRAVVLLCRLGGFVCGCVSNSGACAR